MKKYIIIAALFLGFALGNTSCSKEPTTHAQTTIDNFVSTYFADTEILSCVRDGVDYDVTLSDYTHIEFDGNLFGQLDWDEVDCKHSMVYPSVPDSLIPDKISTHVANYHPGRSIVKISKDRREWDIELDNGVEIEFDSAFNVIEID